MAIFIDDIYIKFYNTVRAQGIPLQTQQAEYNAMDSFYKLLVDDNSVTERQSIYILRLLKKYLPVSQSYGYDFDELLKNAIWKYPFRIIDETRRVFVTSEDTELRINLKFPYSFKNTYDAFVTSSRAIGRRYIKEAWNKDLKVQYLSPYAVNLLDLQMFLNGYDFEIDDSFELLISNYEEIISQEESIIPKCYIDQDQVKLKNCSEDAEEYFRTYKLNNIDYDLMLAKNMAIPLESHTNYASPIAEICKHSSTMFNAEFEKVFDIFKRIQNKICILVSDDGSAYDWTYDFVKRAKDNNVEDIRVCFRSKENGEDGDTFNNWIREEGVGGSIASGKIFIFKGKPAKWLFTNNIKTDIICTNGVNLIANRLTQMLIRQHHCVIQLANNAAPYKEGKIVNL
jgi:hypothetical protein